VSRALLVIDVQEDYFAGGVLPLWHAEEIETRIVSAIGQALLAGDKVVLVQHISTAPNGLFAAGSPGSAIRPPIIAAARDAPIVVKQHADAFQNTDLMEHLVGIDELLICGMMTQNCVVFTAMSRDADGFRVQVLGDLCTAPTQTVHQIALNALGSKMEVGTEADIWDLP
jgi:nicotinamidase-related amidase